MNRRVPSFRLSFVFAISLALLLTSLTPGPLAQTGRATRRTGTRGAAPNIQPEAGRGVPSTHTRPEIAAMLREIDARNIERTIRKLVSFGTRNTLSAQDDPARGIGAARDWIYQQMQSYSRDSGGRLKVELQSFEQQPGRFQRIQKATKI